jgi:hypothetical protein
VICPSPIAPVTLSSSAASGTGKTHLATAIGVAGITRHGELVRFYSPVDLVNALESMIKDCLEGVEYPACRGATCTLLVANLWMDLRLVQRIHLSIGSI